MPTGHVMREFRGHFLSGGGRGAIIRVLITGIAGFLAVMVVAGLEGISFSAGLAAGLVLTFLNLFALAILLVLSLSFIVLSLGLFLIGVNALLLELTSFLVTGFSVAGFWPAVGGGVVISLVTMILNMWTGDHRQTERDALPQRPPKIINPDE